MNSKIVFSFLPSDRWFTQLTLDSIIDISIESSRYYSRSNKQISCGSLSLIVTMTSKKERERGEKAKNKLLTKRNLLISSKHIRSRAWPTINLAFQVNRSGDRIPNGEKIRVRTPNRGSSFSDLFSHLIIFWQDRTSFCPCHQYSWWKWQLTQDSCTWNPLFFSRELTCFLYELERSQVSSKDVWNLTSGSLIFVLFRRRFNYHLPCFLIKSNICKSIVDM